MAKTYLRKEILLDKQETELLRFVMKCTGLDMTTTMRLMIRRGIIEEIIRYRIDGVPKLPDELQKVVTEF